MTFELHIMSGSGTGVIVQSALTEMGLTKGKDYTIDWFPFTTLQEPEHAKHQPYKRSPWLRDTESGMELYESRVICKYIATKVGSPLMPPVDPSSEAYWQFDKMCSVDISMIATWGMPLVVEYVYAVPIFGRAIKTDIIESCEFELKRSLIGHEAILGKQRYLCSDELSLVDIFQQFLLKILHDNGGAKYLTDGTYPNIQRWYEALTARPAFVKPFEEMMAEFRTMKDMLKSKDAAAQY